MIFIPRNQVVGAKYVRLYPPSLDSCMYPHEGKMSNSSQVDVESPDMSRFPLFSGAKDGFQHCVLGEREMLYIPPGWWHFVRSLEVSFSVSFWWGKRRVFVRGEAIG